MEAIALNAELDMWVKACELILSWKDASKLAQPEPAIKQPRTYYIYGLCDPRDGQLRYVGQTVNLHQRLMGHMSDAKTRQNSRTRWLRELESLQLKPISITIETIETADHAEVNSRERYWIRWNIKEGKRLLNDGKGD